MENVRLIEFKSHGSEEDGFLTAIEKNCGLPFDIKRVYTINNTKENNVRGYHAHKTLEQVIFAIHGEIDIMCENQEGKQEIYKLNSANFGLYCGPLIWHTLTYHGDAILMVLASQGFNEEDYIRDYDEFKKYKG